MVNEKDVKRREIREVISKFVGTKDPYRFNESEYKKKESVILDTFNDVRKAFEQNRMNKQDYTMMCESLDKRLFELDLTYLSPAVMLYHTFSEALEVEERIMDNFEKWRLQMNGIIGDMNDIRRRLTQLESNTDAK